MARPLLIPNPENATIEELKQLMHRPEVDIWFADESGFEGDPRPRKRWDKKGSKTRVTKNGGHLRMNVIGMVCPRTGQFFAIEASHSDSATFQAFLDEAAKMVCFQRTTNMLIVDNATWHRRKSTHWHRWQPKYLPPYSPELNPIERIWLTMKARWFNNYVCKNEDHLIARLDQAYARIDFIRVKGFGDKIHRTQGQSPDFFFCALQSG